MRHILLALVLIQIPVVALAAPYGHYQVGDALQQVSTHDADGQASHFAALKKIIADLSAHAGARPVHFDNSDDLHRAQTDVRDLSAGLDALTRAAMPETGVLEAAASVNAIGTHLGIDGSEQRASAAFQALLHRDPDNARANYLYGKFLFEAGKPHDAIPPLEKAQKLGLVYADYPLGLSYLAAGFTDRALENLQNYSKRVPGDTHVTKTIAALRSRSPQ